MAGWKYQTRRTLPSRTPWTASAAWVRSPDFPCHPRPVGDRVTLRYEQHIGVPTSCFGETDYFVTEVRNVE